jgi:hypothetical protein
MRWTALSELEILDFTPLAANWQEMGKGRPEGLHLSDILYGQMYDDHFGEPPWKKDPDDPEHPNVRMQMGFFWERMVEHVWKEFGQVQPQHKIDTQIQVQKDGIHMTPDGVLWSPDENSVLIECKATWRSLKRWEEDPEENFLVWFWQAKSYMLALGLNQLEFWVFWVNGDYRYKNGRGPIALKQRFEFSDEQLEENWAAILRYKEIHVRQQAQKDVLHSTPEDGVPIDC